MKNIKVIASAFGLFTLLILAPIANGQWKQGIGISNTNVSSLASYNNFIAASVGTSDLDSIFISSDNGQTWILASSDVPFITSSMAALGESLVLGDNAGGIVYSMDAGKTWNQDTAGFSNPDVTQYGVNCMVTIGNKIYAGNDVGMCQQTAPGAVWTQDTNGLNCSNGPPHVASIILSGANLFAGTFLGGVYISTNSGKQWSPVNTGLPSLWTTLFSGGITVFAADSIVYAAGPSSGVNGGAPPTDIYSTTNKGQSWSQANIKSQEWGTVYGFTTIQHYLFAATDSGVILSSDSGANWTQSNLGLPAKAVGALNAGSGKAICVLVSGDNLVIGSQYSGAWYRPISDFGISLGVDPIVISSSDAGLNLALSENPVSSNETKVTYSLKDYGPVQVSLVDVLGRSVMLQSGRGQIGENEVTINPLKFEPGTYFVRVEAGGMSVMQKLVISR